MKRRPPLWLRLLDAGVVLVFAGALLGESRAMAVPMAMVVVGLAMVVLAWGWRQMARCRACRAEIEWVLTPRGKWMPVDARPYFVIREAAPDGVLEQYRAAVVTDEGAVVWGIVVGQDDSLSGAAEIARLVGGTIGRRPHWASCPDAERFSDRRKGRGRGARRAGGAVVDRAAR